jgi:hypothetical protein
MINAKPAWPVEMPPAPPTADLPIATIVVELVARAHKLAEQPA